MYWLWLFCLYSFLGYLLEKIFAAVTGSRHQVRKCFLLLPLCPVYGKHEGDIRDNCRNDRQQYQIDK